MAFLAAGPAARGAAALAPRARHRAMTRARVGPAEPGLKARGQLQRPCTHGAHGELEAAAARMGGVFFSLFLFCQVAGSAVRLVRGTGAPVSSSPRIRGFRRTRQLARLGTTSRVHSSTRWYPQVCLRGVPGNPLRVKNDKSRNPRPQARAGNLVRNTHLVLVSVPFCGLSPRRHNFALGRAAARSLTCAPTAPRSREAPRKPGSARNPARAPPNIANPVRVFRLSGLCARPGTLGTRFATVK